MRRLFLIWLIFMAILSCQKTDKTVDPNYENNLRITLNLPADTLLSYISSAKVTVTGEDIFPPLIQAIQWPDVQAESVVVEAYAPAGSDRHFTLHLFQPDGKVTFWGDYLTDVPDSDEFSFAVTISQAAYGSASKIKIFRDNLPWNSQALDNLLTELGIILGTEENQYAIWGSESLDTVTLSAGEDLIIVANDQSQEFYDNYSASQQKINAFVEDGGTILWEACDLGWARGSIAEAGINLPGSLNIVSGYDSYNYLTSSLWKITSGLDSVLCGTYASHEGFTNLRPEAVEYTIDSRGLPTLVSYSYGAGWVIVSGQPLEYSYDRIDSLNTGGLLPNIIRFLLGLEPELNRDANPQYIPPPADFGCSSTRSER